MNTQPPLSFPNESDLKKFQLAQSLMKGYLAAREGLTLLKILRSDRTLIADYSEWLAGCLFGLELSANRVQKGWDLKDLKTGVRYQVKARTVNSLDDRTSFDFKNDELDFDFVLCFLFDHELTLLQIISVPVDTVREIGNQNVNRFSLRWNKKFRAHPSVTVKYPDSTMPVITTSPPNFVDE